MISYLNKKSEKFIQYNFSIVIQIINLFRFRPTLEDGKSGKL